MARLILLLWLLVAPVAGAQDSNAQASYDPDTRTWSLTNDLVAARYSLDDNGLFRLQALEQVGGTRWVADNAPASSPIYLEVDDVVLDTTTPWQLADTRVEAAEPDGQRHVILLRNSDFQVEVEIRVEIHPGQPFIRSSYAYHNLDTVKHYVTQARFINLRLNSGGELRAFYVNQVRQSSPLLYDTIDTWLSAGEPLALYTGAYADHCTWLVLTDQATNGVILGWEANTPSQVTALREDTAQSVSIEGGPLDLHVPVAPGEWLRLPASFVGFFQGDWDEAGYRTQRYVEAVLAEPLPDDNFPYFMFDSWGYQQNINERTLRRAAEIAAHTGVELFIVDLGWARSIGDWREDPQKFPSGLRAFSDYVHSLGMKFGLHFVPVEAAEDAPVLMQNPDWTATEEGAYFFAEPLCISNRPTQEWLRDSALSLVQTYNVDWFVQDAENLVKSCTKETHTHDPANSKWDNSVNGLDAFMDFMRATAPQVGWENNADGGTMASFGAVKNYTTFGSCDACWANDRREVVDGMSYVFPPRFISRYTGEEPNRFDARSSMFGGPWILMQRITEWTPAEIELVRQEASIYKSLRGLIREGKVYHLLPRPRPDTIGAIESFHPEWDRAVVFVYRAESSVDSQIIYPRGLDPEHSYTVNFQESREVFSSKGADLMDQGIKVKLPTEQFAEIIYITGGSLAPAFKPSKRDTIK
jgi:hypothetical protein